MQSDKPKHIKFENQQNIKSQFDIVKLEDLFQRKNLDHSIENHHKVEFYILLFIEKGEGYHTIDFTDYQCSKGTILTIRKDQIHKFFINENVKGTLLIFTEDFLSSYLDELEGNKTLQLFNELLGSPKIQLNDLEFNDIHQIKNRLGIEYFENEDNFSLSIVRSELHILITKLFRIKSLKNNIDFKKKHLKEFITFQNLVEKKVTKTTRVLDYASELGISSKTLNTVTQSIVNKSAKEFIDQICTKQIKRLLLNTNLSIKEIAYQSGFEETTNFYKYFKRQTQITPEQYRLKK